MHSGNSDEAAAEERDEDAAIRQQQIANKLLVEQTRKKELEIMRDQGKLNWKG